MNLAHLFPAMRKVLAVDTDMAQQPAPNKALAPTVWSSFAKRICNGMPLLQRTAFQRVHVAAADRSRCRTWVSVLPR